MIKIDHRFFSYSSFSSLKENQNKKEKKEYESFKSILDKEIEKLQQPKKLTNKKDNKDGRL